MSSYAFVAWALLTVQGPLTAEVPQVALVPEDVNVAADKQHVTLPSELVAARVRDVLRDHRDSEAWKQLAGALPGMAFAGGADLSSTLEAGRLADSISAASRLPTVRGWRQWLPPRLSLPKVGPIRLSLPKVGPMVVVLLALVLARGVSRTGKGLTDRQNRQSLKRRAKTTEASVESSSNLCFVKTLAMSGRPINEIACQTRMTRDAVLILLELQAEGTPQGITEGGKPWWHGAPPARRRKAGSARNAQPSTGVDA